MNSNTNLLLVMPIVSTGLAAGLLYGWLVSVIPGTRRVSDRTYVETMQSINLAIINPAFVVVYFLSPVLLAAAAAWQVQIGNHRRALLLGVAAGVYLVGVVGVTVGGNVPLNNELDRFDAVRSTDQQVVDRRRAYETRWNTWHVVRTLSSVAAFALAAAAPTVAEGD